MKKIIAILAMLLLAACATPTLPPGASAELAPGEGLLAVGFDRGQSPVRWMVLSSKDAASSVRVNNVAANLSLYLYEVKAGRYCLDKYSTGFSTFRSKDPTKGLCATVLPGRLSYFGHITPAPKVSKVTYDPSGKPEVHYDSDLYQTHQYELLYEQLRRDYPAIFQRYAWQVEEPVLNRIEYVGPQSGVTGTH